MATGVCPFCGKKVNKVIMFRGDIVGCRYCGIHTKQTNADRLRAMSDEELSEWLAKNDPECDPPEWWLDWLRQEAKEGE